MVQKFTERSSQKFFRRLFFLNVKGYPLTKRIFFEKVSHCLKKPMGDPLVSLYFCRFFSVSPQIFLYRYVLCIFSRRFSSEKSPTITVASF